MPRKARRETSTPSVWRPKVTSAQVSRRERIRLIAFGNIGDLFDEHGNLRPPETLPPEVACTVASITRRRHRDGSETIAVRLRDKAKAVRRLAIETGLIRE